MRWGQVVKLRMTDKRAVSSRTRPKERGKLTRGVYLLGGYSWKGCTGNQAARLVNEREGISDASGTDQDAWIKDGRKATRSSFAAS